MKLSETSVPFLLLLLQFISLGQSLRVSGGSKTLAPRLEGEEFRAVVATTRRRRRTSTPRPKKEEDGSYYDEDVTLGPIIIPAESEETDESSYEEEEEVRPAPDRAGNCPSLAQLCHQLSYRRLLQRFCQSTCGRDNCLDQREDLCIHWKSRGFCTHPFYESQRWRCSRTCGICRPINP